MLKNTPARERLTIEQLLDLQAQVPFLATVEPVANNPKVVRITPWRPGRGCQCHLAVTLAKESLEYAIPTGAFRICCGKTLRVVEAYFRKGAQISVEELFKGIAEAQNAKQSRRDVEAMYEPEWSRPGPLGFSRRK